MMIILVLHSLNTIKKIDKQEQLNKNYEQDIAKLKAEIAQQSKTQA